MSFDEDASMIRPEMTTAFAFWWTDYGRAV